MMHPMRRISVLLIVGFSAGCATRAGIDAERLQGSWTVVAVERKGATGDVEVGSFLIFNGTGVNYIPRLDGLFAEARERERIPDGTR